MPSKRTWRPEKREEEHFADFQKKKSSPPPDQLEKEEEIRQHKTASRGLEVSWAAAVDDQVRDFPRNVRNARLRQSHESAHNCRAKVWWSQTPSVVVYLNLNELSRWFLFSHQVLYTSYRHGYICVKSHSSNFSEVLSHWVCLMLRFWQMLT